MANGNGFFSGLFSGIGNVLNTFAQSDLGGSFLGALGELGIAKLGSLVGLTPTVSGAPSGFGPPGFGPAAPAPIGPMGPGAIGPLGTIHQFPLSQIDVAALQAQLNMFHSLSPIRQQDLLNTIAQNFAAAIPFLTPPPPPAAAAPAPAFNVGTQPATLPFVPGTGLTFGGSTMPSFPTSVSPGFAPSPFLNAVFPSTPGGFQPAGFPAIAKQLPGIVGGFLGGELLGGLVGGGGGGTPMFRPTMAGARAQFFRTQNPATGQDTWFRPAGRPLLWSGDLTACKRVNKVAQRARRKT